MRIKYENIKHIYSILYAEYGKQNWWPIIKDNRSVYSQDFSNRAKNSEEKLEISIGAILTQNTNWNNAGRSLIKLKEKGLLNIDILHNIELKELADIIRSSGYYNQKAKKIKLIIDFIINDLSGNIENLSSYDLHDARERLLSIWGIGKETCDSILLYAFDFLIFIIDNYTRRLFHRIGLIDGTEEYDDIRHLIESEADRDITVYREYHALIVNLSKIHCKKKPDCIKCPLEKLCLYREASR